MGIAAELANRYRLRLSATTANWLDAGCQPWRSFEEEFDQPVDPRGLLSLRQAEIWGGLMLPDTLPIIGNGGGDCLCLRISPDGTISEVIRWLHEGGLWNPVADSLDDLVRADDSHGPEAVLSDVERRRRRCADCLRGPLYNACRSRGGRSIARSAGISWWTLELYLMDTARCPIEVASRLGEILQIPVSELLHQDWTGADNEAMAVIGERMDLAWPFAVAGWAAERSGDTERAVEIYRQGLDSLGSSASLTDSWRTQERESRLGKFVARRLRDLLGQDCTPYVHASTSGKARQYWSNLAQRAESLGNHAEAYDLFYRAGLDEFQTVDEPLLASLVRCATVAGWSALAAIGEAHRISRTGVGF